MTKLGYNAEKGNFSFKSRVITVSILTETPSTAQVVSATNSDVAQRASALVLANQLDNTQIGDSEDFLDENDEEYSVFIDSQAGSVNANFAIINNTADDKLITFDMTKVNGGKANFAPSTGVN